MITTLSAPCWHRLPTNNQEEVDLAEWDPHYDTREEIVADDGADFPSKTEQLPGPCRVLACDGCGDEATNDDVGGTIHFPPDLDPDMKLVAFEEFGGKVLCDPCMENAQREELQKVGG